MSARRPRGSPLLLAAVASLALHVLWWMTCSPGSRVWRAQPPRQGDPQAIYASRGAGDREGDGDAHAIWSPALFALPTPLGFSAGQGPSAITSPPPLVVSSSAPQWLARADAGVERDAVSAASPSAGLPERDPPAQPVEARVFSPFPAPTGRVLYITWYMHNGSTVQHALSMADSEAAWVGEKPWEAVLRVERRAEGGPERVLLETPTASAERNRGLLRGFMASRREWPPDESARVRIRFDGIPVTAPATP
jgi:hypothetical protein